MNHLTSPFPLWGKVARGRTRADAQHRSLPQYMLHQKPLASPTVLIRPSGTFSQREKGEGVQQ